MMNRRFLNKDLRKSPNDGLWRKFGLQNSQLSVMLDYMIDVSSVFIYFKELMTSKEGAMFKSCP